MLYCQDWDRIQKRFEEFWARENHDRPLIRISAMKDGCEAPPVSRHDSKKARWMDTEYTLAFENWRMRNTVHLGEAFPALNPNLGPDFFATAYGAQLEFGETTSWAHPVFTDDDVESYRGMVRNIHNEYYAKMDEITRAAVEDGKDKYLVGVTDLHPGADALVSLRGPQQLCYDLFDYPEFIRQGVMDLYPDFLDVYDRLYGMTTRYQKGSTCWMPLWHSGRWYPVSCDFSCMVSSEVYEDMIVREIEMEVAALDASIYHLDGPDALRHLDRILEIPGLNGVQWVYGSGQPTAAHWLNVIRRIQDAGKCVYIEVTPQELPFMLQAVPPEGVFYNVIDVGSEDEARRLMKIAEERR